MAKRYVQKCGIFPVCAPPPPPTSLVGAYYLHPTDARAIFLHNGLPCNGMCFETAGGGGGGGITYCGGGGGVKIVSVDM